MDFNNTQAIYLQIADYVCEQIQLQQWQTEDKIPSVRDMAVNLEVNPNTVMRSYDHLQQQEIIHTRRGMGYFVSEYATKKIIEVRRAQFLKEELPLFFRKIYMLGIEPKDLQAEFEQFKKAEKNGHPPNSKS
jgi:DNA-binding transcriptional regulator YhcF (GntR family)